MPEYGVELPLWGDYDASRLGGELMRDLRVWQSTFDNNFDPFAGGWQEDRLRDEWAREANALIQRLQAALPRGTDLEVDLWPLFPV